MSIQRIVIIEDEKPAARSLERKLKALGYAVDKYLGTVEEAVDYFKNNTHPDLIFLDIQLSDGLSFEIFEQVNVNSSIIFTTAYDEYALKAFKLNSIDYLLKPIGQEELSYAVNKYLNNRSATYDFSERLNVFQEFLKGGSTQSYKERFSVKIGTQIKIITIDQIMCLFSENKATYLKTLDNRNYLLDQSLEEIDKQLDPACFFRINRKYIINIKSIQEIHSYSNSRLLLHLVNYQNLDLIVSREKVNDFKNWLE
ncbi:LytR/AlgR family response regulator transcription factor [Myroides sp. LJL119]